MDHLETLDRCARVDNAPEQRLRIRTRRHLDFKEAVRIVCALHQGVIPQDRSDALQSITLESEGDVSLPMLFLDVRNRAIQHFLAASDDANRIAESLGVLHQMGAEYHRLASLLELDDGVL